MQSRRSVIQKSNRTRRRKTSLSCESCRERKFRCDGLKPICGPCAQRSHVVDRCVYKRSSCRLASNDEYLQILYRHIRELEEACQKAGIPVPTFDPEDSSRDSDGEELPLPPQLNSLTALPDYANYPSFPPPIKPETFPSLLTNPQENLNVLGPTKPVGESEGILKKPHEFVSSPSTAYLIRLLTRGPLLQSFSYGPTRSHLDGFLLPPRDLADHLLDCYWDRVFCLYPFFDRPSFQDAYESLWLSYNHPAKRLSILNIGLGGRSDSGPRSAVFICALNMMFALGCHFADFPLPDRNAIAHTFFLRAKQHIGLDLLEVRSVGVVQTLLITSLYFQSMPDPQKSWDLIGVACRIAQGLGLHESQPDNNFKDPLELEIQRRTWHGCVTMDIIVSMAYDRPCTAFHLTSIPLPGTVDLTLTDSKGPSLTTFYTASIELCRILGHIPSEGDNARCDRSSLSAVSITALQGGLDVIVKLEEKLSKFESSLPLCLNWCRPTNPATDQPLLFTLRRQRNVLHARFLYLHILLYRPAFTQVCSEILAQEDSDIDHYEPAHRTLYSSMSSKCALKCARAAIELVCLIYDTYQTSFTDTWWYNTSYTSTAGMVIIMSYTCLSTLPEFDKAAMGKAWRKCEQILQYMIPFQFSIRNMLLFLQAAHSRVLSYLQDEGDMGANDVGLNSSHVNGIPNPFSDDSGSQTLGETNWQGSAVAVDGQGFSFPADFKWFQEWLAEELP